METCTQCHSDARVICTLCGALLCRNPECSALHIREHEITQPRLIEGEE